MRPAFGRPPRLEPAGEADWFGGSAAEAARTLGALDVANRWLGGIRSVLAPAGPLLVAAGRRPLRVLEVGCGGGEMARALVTRARRRRLEVEVVAVDRDPAVLGWAAARSRAFPEIRFVQGDARRLPFGAGAFDWVVSSMLLHYFPSAAAGDLLRAWRGLARRGAIVNDIERHWMPCLLLEALGRLAPRLARAGWRRTILRGWSPTELERLAAGAGFAGATVRRYFPFRVTLVGVIAPAATRGA